MGVAPLVFLAEKMKGIQNTVLIGAKAASQILCEKEFRKSGFDVKIATEDGSRGFKGLVTELLKEVLASGCKYAALYSCGPHLMLKETALIAKSYNIPAEVSLEEHMACGIGACLGCVVATRSGFKRVCNEGPVFKAEDVIL
jgi:dihydroorotate dehydrogenase electron transfer subunit